MSDYDWQRDLVNNKNENNVVPTDSIFKDLKLKWNKLQCFLFGHRYKPHFRETKKRWKIKYYKCERCGHRINVTDYDKKYRYKGW